MLSLTLVLLSQIGAPQGVRLLDDTPLLAQVAPPLVPSDPLASDAQVSAQQLQVDIEGLRRQRPGLGGGITLVSVGGGAALLGVLYLAVSQLSFGGIGVNPFLIIGAVGLGIGLPLVAIGVWLLYNRLEERQRIDHETKRLKQQRQQRLQLEQRQLQEQRRDTPPSRPEPLNVPPPQVRGPDATILLAQFD